MSDLPIFIEPKEGSKGRTFRATALAVVRAQIWPGSDGGDWRPAWAMLAVSEGEIRPFMANLLGGRKAKIYPDTAGSRNRSNHFEILKSAGYETTYQREPEGVVATVYLPDLFAIDPGMVDSEGASFIVLPSRAWAAEQTIDDVSIREHLKKLPKDRHGDRPICDEIKRHFPVISYLFAAYLDRRTRAPLLADGRFFAQVLLAFLVDGLAGVSKPPGSAPRCLGESAFCYSEIGTADVGLLPGIVCSAKHAAIEAILAREIETFFKITGG